MARRFFWSNHYSEKNENINCLKAQVEYNEKLYKTYKEQNEKLKETHKKQINKYKDDILKE